MKETSFEALRAKLSAIQATVEPAKPSATPTKKTVAPAKVTVAPAKVTVASSKAPATPANAERWRNSSVHPELMVSDRGRVRAREYQIVTPDKDGNFRIYQVPAKTLDTRISDSGSVMVNFTNTAGHHIVEDVAFLVATEFVTNEDPAKYTKLKFRDLNRANIKPSNLYWDGVGVYSKK